MFGEMKMFGKDEMAADRRKSEVDLWLQKLLELRIAEAVKLGLLVPAKADQRAAPSKNTLEIAGRKVERGLSGFVHSYARRARAQKNGVSPVDYLGWLLAEAKAEDRVFDAVRLSRLREGIAQFLKDDKFSAEKTPSAIVDCAGHNRIVRAAEAAEGLRRIGAIKFRRNEVFDASVYGINMPEIEKIGVSRLTQRIIDERLKEINQRVTKILTDNLHSEAEFDRKLRERAEYRAKNWYSLWHSGQMSFQEAEQHRTTNAALRAADNMVEPIPDEKLAEAHEPEKCLDKPIYYFASNDYKAVQAWAEKYGLPDWNRAKIGFDYPPNAVVIPFYKENHGMEGFAEVVLQVADADKRGVKMIAPGRLARALIVAALWDGNANL